MTHEVEDRPKYEKPYLILDVRSPQDFQECHIMQGERGGREHAARSATCQSHSEAGLLSLCGVGLQHETSPTSTSTRTRSRSTY